MTCARDASSKSPWLAAQKTKREVAWASELYAQHPEWLQLDVTLRSVEETAARILRELTSRYGDEHPVTRGYHA
jgi:regulator of PEP synthase PpsR (kinase-PPPase family)